MEIEEVAKEKLKYGIKHKLIFKQRVIQSFDFFFHSFSRACCKYQDFTNREKQLNNKYLSQDYHRVNFESTI